MRVDAQRNRERLLLAARDVFVDLGADAPLEEIARQAGVGIATLYRRFPVREALMRAVAVHVLTEMGAEARAALDEEADPFAALCRYLRRALDLRIAAVMPVLGLRLDLEHDEEVRRAREGVTPVYERIVAAAHDSGQLRSDVGTGDIGMMLIRLSRPLAGAFPRDLDNATAHRQLELMLDGLRARPGSELGPELGPELGSELSPELGTDLGPDAPLTIDGLLRRLG
jgi:AcrR family transcriptional regulator